ncbi:MAG: hypothetical protein KC729_13000 [Candidatus Eisenbacteria bacterium]|uniref:Response regulatory domain-containing protein n=1 Tax=Eiseniibacteriota bacterium TaxID=2212470 RepID=A0A956LZR1_UNCEI|nr:hypothetical protein [Candidatus Eisenbacteria bacterium]
MHPLLLVTDSADLAAEIQRVVESLLGPIAVEVLHEDGRLALSRLQARPEQLAFLPLQMRGMEAITLLRSLGPADAGRVMVLAPDTIPGCRQAWECLALGAADVLPLRGSMTRIKGSRDHRLRQIAIHLGHEGAPPRVEIPDLDDLADRPWIALPELRHLIPMMIWLRRQPRTFPLLMWVPEGPRMRRVVGEELVRGTQWPVRQLSNGDRLVPGQVHLFSDPDLLTLLNRDGRLEAGLRGAAGAPGTWVARREQLQAFGAMPAPFGLLVPEPLEPAETALVNTATPVIRTWREIAASEKYGSAGRSLTIDPLLPSARHEEDVHPEDGQERHVA